MKVYVTWDSLLENVVCVHDKPNKYCSKCKKKAILSSEGYDYEGTHRGTYTVEEKAFTVKTGDQLSGILKTKKTKA